MSEKTAKLLFVPLRSRLFHVITDRHADDGSAERVPQALETDASRYHLTQGDPVLAIETAKADGQEVAHLVVCNVGDRALMTFYDRESGVCGQQMKLHPNQAQEVTILRPDLIGVCFACAP